MHRGRNADGDPPGTLAAFRFTESCDPNSPQQVTTRCAVAQTTRTGVFYPVTMGHHVRFDEQLLRDTAAKNGMNITDEEIADLVENGGYEIMGATEAGIEITDELRARIEQSKQEMHDADFDRRGLDK